MNLSKAIRTMVTPWVAAWLFLGSQQLSRAEVYREDFKEVPAHIPVNQNDLTSTFFTLLRLGPGADQLKLSFHLEIKNDPHYVWNGMCPGPTLLGFQFRRTLDLSDKRAKVRLRTKNFGKSTLHVALRVGDKWYVQQRGIGKQRDWTMSDLALHGNGVKYHLLDKTSFQLGEEVNLPDFRKVSAIGFLSPRKPDRSKDCTRLDWFELRTSSDEAREGG